ncbi:MAG TPA: hypothetical protein VF290_02435 [Pyrinomonadaceae bacterium]
MNRSLKSGFVRGLLEGIVVIILTAIWIYVLVFTPVYDVFTDAIRSVR